MTNRMRKRHRCKAARRERLQAARRASPTPSRIDDLLPYQRAWVEDSSRGMVSLGLAHLPDDAPVEEGEDGSVWEVVIALDHDGYQRTLRWLVDDLGLTRGPA